VRQAVAHGRGALLLRAGDQAAVRRRVVSRQRTTARRSGAERLGRSSCCDSRGHVASTPPGRVRRARRCGQGCPPSVRAHGARPRVDATRRGDPGRLAHRGQVRTSCRRSADPIGDAERLEICARACVGSPAMVSATPRRLQFRARRGRAPERHRPPLRTAS
jgi:hypothetical protein